MNANKVDKFSNRWTKQFDTHNEANTNVKLNLAETQFLYKFSRLQNVGLQFATLNYSKLKETRDFSQNGFLGARK